MPSNPLLTLTLDGEVGVGSSYIKIKIRLYEKGDWKSEKKKREQTKSTEKEKTRQTKEKKHFVSGVERKYDTFHPENEIQRGVEVKKDFLMMKNNPINLHFSS